MKPFYAFYNRSYSYLRAIITLVIGLTMVIWPSQVSGYFVRVIGALLLLAGVISIIYSNTGTRKNEKTSLLSINSIVDICFGLILLLFPNFFMGFITFLFGILLIFFGGGQLFALARARREVEFTWTFFIWPAITTACGVIMFFKPHDTSEWIFIFFGVALLIYSVSEFISTTKIRSLLKNMAKEEAAAEVKAEAVDTPFEEVKEDAAENNGTQPEK